MLYNLILVLVLHHKLRSFPLLSISTDELISAPKIMTFLPMLSSTNKHSERESNPMS